MRKTFTLWKRARHHSLDELDELYRDTVMTLPTETRIEYCRSLIQRCKIDLQHAADNQPQQFSSIIAAAETELSRLERA